MAIFMKFGDKKGDVDTPQYKEWIMCHSFQFGSGRGISSSTASGQNRQGSHASVSEITVTKLLDPASLGCRRRRSRLGKGLHREAGQGQRGNPCSHHSSSLPWAGPE